MDPVPTDMDRPLGIPTPLSPALSNGCQSTQGTQQFLENWMEHFDRRFDELVAIQKQVKSKGARLSMQDAMNGPRLSMQEARTPLVQWSNPWSRDSVARGESKRQNRNRGSQAKLSVSSIQSGTASMVSAEPERTAFSIRFSESQSLDSNEQVLGPAFPREVDSGISMRPEYTKGRITKSDALQARPSMQARISQLYTNLQANKRGIEYTGMSWLVHSNLFENLISGAIIVNGIFIGVQVEIEARDGDPDHAVFSIAEGVFFTIFFLELLLRVVGLRSEWPKSVWNLFDAALVLIQLVELCAKLFGGNANAQGTATGRILRVFRIARIVRVVRLLRFFVQLRVMVKMIMFSLESLFWLMVLLIVMMYVVSIIFTQGVTDYVSQEVADPDRVNFLSENFGDIATSSLSLFEAITNGVGWAVISDELFQVHTVFGVVFVIFIFFVFFSVLNVVTGVFVDGAIQNAGKEREMLVAAERKSLEGMCSKLMELLVDIDTDGSGTISIEELLVCAKDPTLASYFSALEIHTPETAQLFNYLDRDGNGEIDIQEFIDGCLRIRGGARNVDLHMLLFRLEREHGVLQDRITEAFCQLDREISCIHDHIAGVHADIRTSESLSRGKDQAAFSPRFVDGAQESREARPLDMIPSDWHLGKDVSSSATVHVSTPRSPK